MYHGKRKICKKKNLCVVVETWWNEVSTCPVMISEKHVIFGIYYDLKYFADINYIILLGKMYIYRQKLNGENVNFNAFLKIIKNRLEIEKAICNNNQNSTQFNKKWTSVLQSLT